MKFDLLIDIKYTISLLEQKCLNVNFYLATSRDDCYEIFQEITPIVNSYYITIYIDISISGNELEHPI